MDTSYKHNIQWHSLRSPSFCRCSHVDQINKYLSPRCLCRALPCSCASAPRCERRPRVQRVKEELVQAGLFLFSGFSRTSHINFSTVSFYCALSSRHSPCMAWHAAASSSDLEQRCDLMYHVFVLILLYFDAKLPMLAGGTASSRTGRSATRWRRRARGPQGRGSSSFKFKGCSSRMPVATRPGSRCRCWTRRRSSSSIFKGAS